MAARASPRKPRVPMASRSYSVRSLLVAEKGGLRLGGGDAAAVVGNPDEAHAAVLDLHGQGVRPGVDSVLHELLDHRRGPLHHLAGGNLVGELRRQNLNRHPLLLS